MAPRIAPTTDVTAPEETKPLLAALKKTFGSVPNLCATMGQSPAALGGYLAFIEALAKGALSPREMEFVNLHVSELNGCGYCVSAHAAVGRRVGLSPDEIAAARAGRGSSARDSAILSLARRIVRTGGAGAGMEPAYAREVGLTDAESSRSSPTWPARRSRMRWASWHRRRSTSRRRRSCLSRSSPSPQ